MNIYNNAAKSALSPLQKNRAVVKLQRNVNTRLQTAAPPRLHGLAGLQVGFYAPIADEKREERYGLHGGEFAPDAGARTHDEAVEVVLRVAPSRGDEVECGGIVVFVIAYYVYFISIVLEEIKHVIIHTCADHVEEDHVAFLDGDVVHDVGIVVSREVDDRVLFCLTNGDPCGCCIVFLRIRDVEIEIY